MPASEEHRLAYRDQFRSFFNERFQAWFESLAKAMFPTGDFQAIRQTSGDGGLDGLAIDSQTVFQVFAPARMDESRDGDTARKVKADFKTARATLSGRLKSWVFVHNHPEAKIGQLTAATLTELKAKYPDVTFSVLDIDSLWELLNNLPGPILCGLLGRPPLAAVAATTDPAAAASATLPADLAYETDFLRHVRNQFQRFQMVGVPEMRDVRQDLSIAYVPLRLKGAAGAVGDVETAETVVLQHRLLAIRGHAGSGKSTLLNWLAVQCASADAERDPWRGTVPFFIALRRVAHERGVFPPVDQFPGWTVSPRIWPAPAPAGWVIRVLESKRAAVLLDGVDELPRSLRPAFWQWCEELNNQYPGNRIYVTSRYFAGEASGTPASSSFGERYGTLLSLLGVARPETRAPEARGPRWANYLDSWSPPPAFSRADLDDMTDDDVREFVARWHEAVKRTTEDGHARAELADAAERLLPRLSEPPNRRVRELCRSPLLCALVCALHWREAGYLPRRRVELYDRCCTMLLEERDAKRDVPPPEGDLAYLTFQDKEMILQRLALSMMRNRPPVMGPSHQVEVDRQEARAWIEPNLAACVDERARRLKAEQVLDHLIERSGLLREPSPGRVDFPHRSFQEYLAACAAGACNEARDLAKRATDDQWHETIILSAGTKVGGVPFGHAMIEALLGEATSLSEATPAPKPPPADPPHDARDDVRAPADELTWTALSGAGLRFRESRTAPRLVLYPDTSSIWDTWVGGEDWAASQRYTCYVLAVACLETAVQVNSELRSRVLGHLKEIVPPRNAQQAKWLAAAGDAVLPLLSFDRWQDEALDVIEACAQTVVHVGTSRAAEMLEDFRGFGGDWREPILAQVCACRAVHPLRMPFVVDRIQRWVHEFPAVIRQRVESATDLEPATRLTCESLHLLGWTSVEDVSPVARNRLLRHVSFTGCPSVASFDPLSSHAGFRSLGMRVSESGLTAQAADDPSRVSPAPESQPVPVDHHGQVAHTVGGRQEAELTLHIDIDWRRQAQEEKAKLIAQETERARRQEQLIAQQTERARRQRQLRRGSLFQSLCRLLASAAAKHLETLVLGGFDELSDLAPLAGITGLRRCGLEGVSSLQDLDQIAALRELHGLYVSGARGLNDLAPIERLRELECLYLDGCDVRGTASRLPVVPSVRSLGFRGCSTLVFDLSALPGYINLISLNLANCENVTDLRPLERLHTLEYLNLWGCDQIVNFSPIASLPRLKRLVIGDHRLILRLPESLRPLTTVGSTPMGMPAGPSLLVAPDDSQSRQA